MALDLVELKRLHDKSYNQNTITRERASDDMLFYHVSNWDDQLLGESQLQYRGEFNVLKKAGRQIMADLRSNPVQVDFEPKLIDRDDGADLLDGLYRSDDRVNTSIEAYDNAKNEAVVCGFGAWEMVTEYETNRMGDENQVIRRRPIYEANNNCYFDPNAKLLDKSDANYCSILIPYSRDGYEDLVEDLTGEEITVNYDSFRQPEESYTFPWAAGENEAIYVSRFYHRERVKDKILTFEDPLGQPITLRESDLDEIMDDLIDQGYEIVSEKEIRRWKVKLYIASGSDILKVYDIPGENIPVIPTYGERAFVEGEEHYEGVTRLAKDPQRLRNFQLSYLADIVSRSPRPKPIFTPEQIQGFEHMYEESGSDNNYPYLYQNSQDANGRELPIGPISVMPEQTMPQALAASIDLTRQAVEDVANPGLPQDIADPDLSGKAVIALQNRLDQQSIVYQQNYKHAKRRDAEVYASIASETYDAPRTVTVTKADGSREKIQVMEGVIDQETGDLVVLNDLTNMEFEVYADIGPAYASQKEQTIETLGGMADAVAATDPALQKALILKQLAMVDGVDMDDIREYANKQLVLSGFREPQTEEEEEMVAALAQQGDEPDPNMVLAQAEMLKGQAQLAETQRKALVDSVNAETNQAKIDIDTFRAQTERINTQIDAQKAGADINLKNVQAIDKQVDTRLKAVNEFRARLQPVEQSYG